MKTQKLKSFVFILLLIYFAGCDIFDPGHISDPNNPSVEEVLQGANQAQLQNLVSGLQARNRNTTANMAQTIGSFGREIYPFRASDPRNVNDLLGIANDANAETDPSFRGLASVWSNPYATIKQANILIESVNNTNNIGDQQKQGFLGLAKTIKGYEYLIPLLTQSKENGIRIDVSDPLNPGPFVSFNEAMKQIRSLLDEARSDLQQAGDSFNFELTNGLDSFNTPSTFVQLNRAIAARAAIYAKDWQGALDALEAAKPFFELGTGAALMNKGAYFVYTGPPGAFNPFYYPPNAQTNQIEMVHPSMITDAEDGDERAAYKFFRRNDPISLQGLSARYQDDRFESNTDSFPWVRNEELILIYAEANAQLSNYTKADGAINDVRTTWGLNDFNSTNLDQMIDQLLYERRYSLWYEFGHRWIDAKRYNRLDQLPTDGGKIFQYYARPLSEINWNDLHGGDQ